MLSLVEVRCPHCGARGQVVVPPLGALLIGPCPQCDELILVFCGKALPLSREIMDGANPSEKREHLMATLFGFLDERIDEVLKEMESGGSPQAAARGTAPEEEAEDANEFPGLTAEFNAADPAELAKAFGEEEPESDISPTEVDQFVRTALPLLDNKHYFHAIFG